MNEYYNSSNVLEGNEFCGLWFPGSQNYLYFYRSSRMISVWCIFLDTKVSVPIYIYRVPIRKKIETQHIVRFDYIWPVVEPGDSSWGHAPRPQHSGKAFLIPLYIF
jgi:hypothetical protein